MMDYLQYFLQGAFRRMGWDAAKEFSRAGRGGKNAQAPVPVLVPEGGGHGSGSRPRKPWRALWKLILGFVLFGVFLCLFWAGAELLLSIGKKKEPKLEKVYNYGTFIREEGAYIHNEGTGVIEGYAFRIRSSQENKGWRCDDKSVVSLGPVTNYRMARMARLYGNTFAGDNFDRKLPQSEDGYIEQTRRTTCDAEGNFKFVNVPDGKFFVTVSIYGVHLMQQVKLQEGRRRIYVKLVSVERP